MNKVEFKPALLSGIRGFILLLSFLLFLFALIFINTGVSNFFSGPTSVDTFRNIATFFSIIFWTILTLPMILNKRKILIENSTVDFIQKPIFQNQSEDKINLDEVKSIEKGIIEFYSSKLVVGRRKILVFTTKNNTKKEINVSFYDDKTVNKALAYLKNNFSNIQVDQNIKTWKKSADHPEQSQ